MSCRLTRRRAALVALTLTAASAASAYIRSTATGTVDGPPLFRTDFESIQFYVQSLVEPGYTNAQGLPVITPTSEPLAALQAALNSWSSIESSAVKFLPLEPTEAGFDLTDARNVMVFEDTPTTRSLTGGATAVTAVSFTPEGRILESDIVFNPAYRPGNNQIPFSPKKALTMTSAPPMRKVCAPSLWVFSQTSSLTSVHGVRMPMKKLRLAFSIKKLIPMNNNPTTGTNIYVMLNW